MGSRCAKWNGWEFGIDLALPHFTLIKGDAKKTTHFFFIVYNLISFHYFVTNFAALIILLSVNIVPKMCSSRVDNWKSWRQTKRAFLSYIFAFFPFFCSELHQLCIFLNDFLLGIVLHNTNMNPYNCWKICRMKKSCK